MIHHATPHPSMLLLAIGVALIVIAILWGIHDYTRSGRIASQATEGWTPSGPPTLRLPDADRQP